LPAVRHLGFLKLQISNCGTHHKESNCVTMPNFVAIGQTVAEISQFWIFQEAAAAILDF